MKKLKGEELQTINLEGFTHAKSKVISRDYNGKTHQGLTIVNARTSSRIILNNDKILKAISYPKSIQISYSENEIIIASFLQNDSSNYIIKKSGKNGVIYNTELIRTITGHFNLDFSGRTSITFPVSAVKHSPNGPVVVINVKSKINEVMEENIESGEVGQLDYSE